MPSTRQLVGMATSLLAVLWQTVCWAQLTSTTSAGELKRLSLDELMNVEVISVSRSPEKLSETASSIQVITQEDIRRSGAGSLPEALRLASNLQVAQKNSHDWAISARGFNTDLANKLLVMIDGRTVYTPLFSGVFWDAQDYLLADIERIEVISGPGGTQWGANAVNGVINIITKHAKDTQGLYVELGGGTPQQSFAGVRYGGTLSSNTQFRVYGKYFDRGNAVLADGGDADDSWHMGQAGFRIDAAPASFDRVTFQGDVYNGSDRLLSGGATKTTGGNVLGRWSRTFSERSDLSLQLYYDHTHLDDPIPPLVLNSIEFAPAGLLKDDLDTYDLDFQHHLHLSRYHSLVWGLGYRYTHDVVSNAPALGFFPPVLDHNLYSGFVQDEISLLDSLQLTLGTKLEHNAYTGLEVEPSGRLQWTVNTQHMLWTAVSRAVRTPSRVDRDLSEPVGSALVILEGSADFKSETVIAYELGYRAQFGSKIATSIATFYNEYRHIRSTSITPNTILPFYFANNLQGDTYGIEFSGTYQAYDWWQLRLGYDPLKEHIHVVPGQMDLNAALNETADPQQRASLRSSMSLPHRLELDAGLRWVETLRINNGPTIGLVPSYIDMDLRLGWHPSNSVEIAIVGQNLLHDHHPEYGYPSATRTEISRSVAAKLVWRL